MSNSQKSNKEILTKIRKARELRTVKDLIERVEEYKNWKSAKNVPIFLRLKSLLQSLLDSEAELRAEKNLLERGSVTVLTKTVEPVVVRKPPPRENIVVEFKAKRLDSNHSSTPRELDALILEAEKLKIQVTEIEVIRQEINKLELAQGQGDGLDGSGVAIFVTDENLPPEILDFQNELKEIDSQIKEIKEDLKRFAQNEGQKDQFLDIENKIKNNGSVGDKNKIEDAKKFVELLRTQVKEIESLRKLAQILRVKENILFKLKILLEANQSKSSPSGKDNPSIPAQSEESAKLILTNLL